MLPSTNLDEEGLVVLLVSKVAQQTVVVLLVQVDVLNQSRLMTQVCSPHSEHCLSRGTLQQVALSCPQHLNSHWESLEVIGSR